MLKLLNFIEKHMKSIVFFYNTLLCTGVFFASLVFSLIKFTSLYYFTWGAKFLLSVCGLILLFYNRRETVVERNIFWCGILLFALLFNRMLIDLYLTDLVLDFKDLKYIGGFFLNVVLPFITLFLINIKSSDFKKMFPIVYGIYFLFCLVNALGNTYTEIPMRSSSISGLWAIGFGQAGTTLSLLSLTGFSLFENVNFKRLCSLGYFLGLSIVFISASKGPFYTIILLSIVFVLLNKSHNLFRTNYFYLIAMCFVAFVIKFRLFALFQRLHQNIQGVDASTQERIEILSASLDVSCSDLIFGKSFLLNTSKLESTYPHNLFLEAFITTGVAGGVLFLFINYMTLKHVIKLIRVNQYQWVVFIFLQYFLQAFYSSTIYSSFFYWVFLSLVINLYYGVVSHSQTVLNQSIPTFSWKWILPTK